MGSYAIGAGNLALSSNYTLTVASGVNFTIVAKAITVTPTSGQSKVYGNADLTLAYSFSPVLHWSAAIRLAAA